jgi:hypothetical protein
VRRGARYLAVAALAVATLGFGRGMAQAQVAIVLPHGGEVSLVAQREQAQASVVRTLREQGLSVRVQESAEAGPVAGNAGDAAQSDPVAGSCTRPACAPALLADIGGELAVAVAVWHGGDAADGQQVNVTVVDRAGNRFPASAAVTGDDVATAARTALLSARALQLLGPGPWIEVRGEPPGADVLVDGAYAGALPYRGALEPGDHRVQLRDGEQTSAERLVRMPLDPTETVRVELAMNAAPAATAADMTLPPDDVVQEPSIWNYILGGSAIGVGVALATIDPIPSALRDGECVDADCEQVYEFGDRSLIQVGVGAALVATGVTLMVWRPFTVETRLGPDHAALYLRGDL